MFLHCVTHSRDKRQTILRPEWFISAETQAKLNDMEKVDEDSARIRVLQVGQSVNTGFCSGFMNARRIVLISINAGAGLTVTPGNSEDQTPE
jgi:hypothetical protein